MLNDFSIQLANAINALRPHSQYSFTNADLSTLIWLDTIQTRPTDEEILALIAAQGK